MPSHKLACPEGVLHARISDVHHVVTVETIRHLFHRSGDGYVICAFEQVVDGMYGVEVYVEFGSRWRAARARDALDGHAIYEGCCILAIDLVPPIYTTITRPDHDELAPAYFYDDTPYAEWAAALAVAERQDMAPSPSDELQIVSEIEESTASPRGDTSAAAVTAPTAPAPTAMHDDDGLTAGTSIHGVVATSAVAVLARNAAAPFVREDDLHLEVSTGASGAPLSTAIREMNPVVKTTITCSTPRPGSTLLPDHIAEGDDPLELGAPAPAKCSTDCVETGTAALLHMFVSDTGPSSTWILVNTQFSSKFGAGAEDIAAYKLSNDDVKWHCWPPSLQVWIEHKGQVPRPRPWPSLEYNLHSYGEFIGGMGAVQEQLQGHATAMVILEFEQHTVGIPTDKRAKRQCIIQIVDYFCNCSWLEYSATLFEFKMRQVLALHISESETPTSVLGTGCYLLHHGQKEGQCSICTNLIPEDAIYYGSDGVQSEIAWLLVFPLYAQSLAIERKPWPPPPSVQGYVPAQEQNAWFDSGVEMFLCGTNYSLTSCVGCHTTGTCLKSKHMGLTVGKDSSCGANKLGLMFSIPVHGCKLIYGFQHEQLWDPGDFYFSACNCQWWMVLVYCKSRLRGVHSTLQWPTLQVNCHFTRMRIMLCRRGQRNEEFNCGTSLDLVVYCGHPALTLVGTLGEFSHSHEICTDLGISLVNVWAVLQALHVRLCRCSVLQQVDTFQKHLVILVVLKPWPSWELSMLVIYCHSTSMHFQWRFAMQKDICSSGFSWFWYCSVERLQTRQYSAVLLQCIAVSSSAGSTCVCNGIVTITSRQHFNLGVLPLVHFKDLSFRRFLCVDQMMLKTGHVIPCGLELFQWKIAWSLSLEYFDVVNLSKQLISAAAPTVLCSPWDPGIWALLCFYRFSAQTEATKRIKDYYFDFFLEQVFYDCYNNLIQVYFDLREVKQHHVLWDPGGLTPCRRIFLEEVSAVYYLNIAKVCLDYGSHRDLGEVMKHQVPWDPGGSTWHRLEVKPKIKEGGMLATILYYGRGLDHALPLLGSGFLEAREAVATYTRGLDTTNSAWIRTASASWLLSLLPHLYTFLCSRSCSSACNGLYL